MIITRLLGRSVDITENISYHMSIRSAELVHAAACQSNALVVIKRLHNYTVLIFYYL